MIKTIGTVSSEMEYDVCIVGSGPAGMVLCAELLSRGVKKICVLESGTFKRGGPADELKKVYTDGLKIRPDSRERVFGGTSDTWTGQYAVLDEHDIVNWPISYKEMARYYQQAAEGYGLPPLNDFTTGKYYLAGRNVAESGLELKTFIVEQPALQFGKALQYIFEQDTIDLLLDATVVGMVSTNSDDGHVVSALSVRNGAGRDFNVSAKSVVLAAGTIENVRILLNTKTLNGISLGNQSDQVGRYFMNRIKGYAGEIIFRNPVPVSSIPFLHEGTDKSYKYIGMQQARLLHVQRDTVSAYSRMEVSYRWERKEAYHLLLECKRAGAGLLKAIRSHQLQQIKTTGRIFFLAAHKYVCTPGSMQVAASVLFADRKYIHILRMRNFVEIPPARDNRISLTDEKDVLGVPYPLVSYILNKKTESSVQLLHEGINHYFKDVAGASLSKSAYSNIETDSSHHLGGTRMGTDPKESVVDKNLKVHTVDNLYVLGGSVFPSCGLANPTYTIIALAVRLAEHLSSISTLSTIGISSFDDKEKKHISIIGGGKRVLYDVIPALESQADYYEIQDIFATSQRKIFRKNGVINVKVTYKQEDLTGLDSIYIAVPAIKIPGVLKTLASFRCEHLTVIIDTPTPDIGQYKACFKQILVAEDSVWLPWIAVLPKVTKTIARKALYEYHGVAFLRTIQESDIYLAFQFLGKRRFWFKNGTRAIMDGGRNYSVGTLDFFDKGGIHSNVSMVVTNDTCEGFLCGERKIELTLGERMLVGPCEETDTIVTKMLALKRVGLSRMFRNIANGEKAWEYENGRRDTNINNCLNRFGIYFSL